MPDLTNHGLTQIRNAVSQIREWGTKRVDLQDGITVYKVPGKDPKKYIIRVDLKFDESEDK